MKEFEELKWSVHTPMMLEEIGTNPQLAVMKVPLNIFANILGQVAERARILNDRELNKLMLRLTLYSAADPSSEDYMGAINLKEYLKSKDSSGDDIEEHF